jgi:hypothetical protein
MALSADTTLDIKNNRSEMIVTGTVKTGATLYKHGLIMAEATGRVTPCADDGATAKFVGLSKKGYVAAETAEMYTNIWCKITKVAGCSAAYLEHEVYAVDDASVTYDTTLGPAVGTLMEIVSSTVGWVWLGHVPGAHSS